MAKGVSLSNGRDWSSQKGATKYFCQIRNRYADKVPIDAEQDHADHLSLLERYDAAHGEGDSRSAAVSISLKFAPIMAQVDRHAAFGCTASMEPRPTLASRGRFAAFSNLKLRNSLMLAGCLWTKS